MFQTLMDSRLFFIGHWNKASAETFVTSFIPMVIIMYKD